MNRSSNRTVPNWNPLLRNRNELRWLGQSIIKLLNWSNNRVRISWKGRKDWPCWNNWLIIRVKREWWAISKREIVSWKKRRCRWTRYMITKRFFKWLVVGLWLKAKMREFYQIKGILPIFKATCQRRSGYGVQSHLQFLESCRNKPIPWAIS